MKVPEITISVQYRGAKRTELKTIKNSKDIHDIIRPLFNQGTIDWTEEVLMLCLNRANKIIGYHRLSSGGLSSVVMDTRAVFTVALNCAGTTSIIMAHNHPSGACVPSSQDDNITDKIKEAGKVLDILLIDHLIIGESGYYSYCDEGKL
jgi:DNA repair protein RadC